VFLPATALTAKAISAVESGLEVIGIFFILAAPADPPTSIFIGPGQRSRGSFGGQSTPHIVPLAITVSAIPKCNRIACTLSDPISSERRRHPVVMHNVEPGRRAVGRWAVSALDSARRVHDLLNEAWRSNRNDPKTDGNQGGALRD
jgi:hypothetical protein